MKERSATRVLVVDDEEMMRLSLADYLRDSGYQVLEASGGVEGVAVLRQESPDVVLSDLRMPDGCGEMVIEAAARHAPETPVIVVSGQSDLHEALRIMRSGAWDYLTKPMRDMELVQLSIDRALERASLLEENRLHRENLERLVKERTSDLAQSNRQLNLALEKAVQCLCTIVTQKDPYTAGHNERVAELSMDVGRVLGLDDYTVEILRLSGMLHDIGKLGIPGEILNKTSPLTDLEYSLVQTHTHRGYEIIREMPFEGPVADITLQHHERFDGRGYPRALQGEEIFLEARIVAVCDVYEALTSHRPYRPAWPRQKALDFIAFRSGTDFDPGCVAAFLEAAATHS